MLTDTLYIYTDTIYENLSLKRQVKGIGIHI